MLKKSAVSILAASMALSAVPVKAAENTANYAVSGYVSAEENGGFMLAGNGKKTVIHIDENEYGSVIRAVRNLSEDMENVTGVAPEINSGDITIESGSISDGISIDGENLTVSLAASLREDAQCYAAVYDSSGALAGIKKSTEKRSEDNSVTRFSFNGTLSKPEGGSIKAFVWGSNMEPLADAMGMAKKKNVSLSGADVIVGTLGTSKTIDALAQSGELNVSEIDGKWESFTIQNVDDTLVIAGSDKRGTIYGIYDLCESMGVSPWQWWADAEPTHADALYINLPDGGYTEGEPSVKYRGIFINDEYNLNQWSKSLGNGEAMTAETYEKVFELILRLKANALWPAMHNYSPAFHSDERNAELADEYGIVMGSSHAEPLLRNNLGELDAFQDKWEAEHPDKTLYKKLKNESGKSVAYYWTDHDENNNAVDNKEFLEAYWRESVAKNGGYENMYTLGMRGVHDGSFQTNMDYAAALNEIIACQRKILQEEICDKTGQKIEDIPQVFIPYKDVLKYYNSGELKIPDDVTIMWTDDNYGYVRQNADDAERARAGRTGIYYHVSYYGYPTSYLWLSSTQPGLIREEMGKSYDMGADKMWILNVGDLKPAEKDIEYFLKLARNIDTRNEDISNIFAANAQRDFNLSNEQAAEYADIMDKYYELANSKRPEFIRSGEISLTAYGDEGQRYLDRCKVLTARAEQMYASLAEEKKDSFYELALYPIRSFKNMMTDYIQTDRANSYAGQGRGASSYRYADEAASAAEQIDIDTAAYNSLRDGKWNNIMNINPSKLQGCDAHITTGLAADKPSALDYTELEVALDSQAELGTEKALSLSVYDTYNKFIDVINRGYGSFEYTVTSDADYIKFSKTEGTANGSDRVYVSIDKSKTPAGKSDAVITVAQKLGDITVDTREIAVSVSNPDLTPDEKMYIEAGGTVSVEAEHYSNAVSNGGHEWKIEKDFGRSGDSVKVYPDLAANVDNPNMTNSAYLEYDIYFENSGTYTLDVYRMPTLNERNNMRFAVGLDGASPEVLKGTSTYSGSQSKSDAWARGVLDNTQKLRTTVTVPESGKHTLRLYSSAPGVIIDKMVLTHGTDVTASYFGAPESYNTTYNTVSESIPSYEDTAAAADIRRLYEPDVLVGMIERTDSQINSVNLVKLTDKYSNAVAAVTAYDAQGNMTAVNFAKADLSETALNGQITVPLSLSLPAETSAYAVTVFDSFANMQLIAPYKEFGTLISEGDSDTIEVKTDLSDYIGRKSIILAADCEITEDITAENIKYLHGEAITADSYKCIPFGGNEAGVYYIRTGIYGEEAIDEVKNTIVNILPDNNGVSEVLNTWSFTEALTDDSGKNAFVINGGASRTDDGKIKMNNTKSGSAVMTYENPVMVSQGGKVTVEFDIYYGKLSKKTMMYTISDSSGNELASVDLCAYDPSVKASVKVGGTELLTDYKQLADVVLRSNNLALKNGATHYKNVFDFGTGRAYITVSSGDKTTEFSGKLGTTAGNIGKINFTTGHDNEDRACYVDDIKVHTQSAPQYEINVIAVNAADGSAVEDAEVTVADAVTKAEILPNIEGKYMLCEGSYIITASANGFRTVQSNMELTPALESKEFKIEMTSDSDLKPASVTIKYVDEESNSLKEDIVISENIYAGESYTVPEELIADFKIKDTEGKVNIYSFNKTKSQTETILAENNELVLVFNMTAQYDYYEDFEDYEVVPDKWRGTSSAVSIANDSGKYLKYASNGNTIGAYTAIDSIDCAGKTVRIETDLKFAPKGTAGNSQFTIGSSSPAFSGGKIDWGIIEGSEGHIVVFEYNTGSTLKINGTAVSSNFIDSWMHMTADVDFAAKKVNIVLTNDSGETAELDNLRFFSSNDITEIGSIYVRAAKSNGTVGVDNLSVLITGEGVPAEPENKSVLNYKSVYAFGDSIVYGHNAPGSAFMNLLTNRYSMTLKKYAKNGATVIDSGNDIIAQVNSAPAEEPDFVVFDGYTNDAYGNPETDSFNAGGSNTDVTTVLGKIQGSSAVEFDNKTFCGAFEEILYTMKQKWPTTQVVFVTIHKSGARNFDIQTQLHDLTVEMCKEWGAEVVDMFNDASLDTRNEDEMKAYIINGAGSHPNVACCEEFYVPMVADKLIELCGGEQ
ncbi:MAG: glycosyl hydrolase 115 family protein [bacterium]|nr:glycosyl hydrolase 115 family protein [bacterium]